MMMYGVSDGGDRNDNSNANEDGDDNGPPPQVVSCGGGGHTGMGFACGYGCGGGMKETETAVFPGMREAVYHQERRL